MENGGWEYSLVLSLLPYHWHQESRSRPGVFLLPHTVPNRQVLPRVTLQNPTAGGLFIMSTLLRRNLRLKEVCKSTQSCTAGLCGSRMGSEAPRSRAYARHCHPTFHTHLKIPPTRELGTPVLGMSQQVKAKRKGQACPLQGVVGKINSNKRTRNRKTAARLQERADSLPFIMSLIPINAKHFQDT